MFKTLRLRLCLDDTINSFPRKKDRRSPIPRLFFQTLMISIPYCYHRGFYFFFFFFTGCVILLLPPFLLLSTKLKLPCYIFLEQATMCKYENIDKQSFYVVQDVKTRRRMYIRTYMHL